jgi:hypothetical protein
MEYWFSQKLGPVYRILVLYTTQNVEPIDVGIRRFNFNRLSMYIENLTEHEGLLHVSSVVNCLFLTLGLYPE